MQAELSLGVCMELEGTSARRNRKKHEPAEIQHFVGQPGRDRARSSRASDGAQDTEWRWSSPLHPGAAAPEPDRRPEPQPRTTAQVAQMAEVSPEDELDAMLKAEGVAEAVPPEKAAAAAGGTVELSGDSLPEAAGVPLFATTAT